MTDPTFRAVLYDFDGTLADSTELILRCYRHTMQTHLGHVPDEADWLSGFGKPLEGQIGRFARTPDEASRMLQSYRDYQHAHHDDALRPFPAACEVVAELAERGIKLAIVTSKHRETALRGLRCCELAGHFPVVVAPEDVVHPKPHPESVRKALDALGVSPSEALFVGDSPFDVMAGKAAGVSTAAALWGPFPEEALRAAGPDHLLVTQAAVLSLVEGQASIRRESAA